MGRCAGGLNVVEHFPPVTSGNTQLSVAATSADVLSPDASVAQSIAAPAAQSIEPGVPPTSAPVGQYLNAAIADNTRRAYQQDLRDFLAWGGAIPCGSEVLAEYISDRAETLSAHTLTRRVVGIGRAHVSQGYADPAKTDLVRTVLRGVRRVKGTSQRQVSPLLRSDVLAMTANQKGTKGIRDRALILVGFAAALRRSELASLDCADVQFVREGMVIHLRRSKTDQEGEGRKIGVPWGRTSACPVKALESWLSSACISEGPVFRSVSRAGRIGKAALSAQSIALILKVHATAVGLEPSTIAGHSLRSGLVTSAIQAGVPLHKIQQQTGHRSVAMLARYIRDAGLFDSNASGAVL